ncbi:MAG: UDP-N-acetylmuramate dehydrogenase [Anaerolineae bacterium]|nr:UDP-N-acetylmuramate dehydrogenase [Anaerolineae bacterium]
MPLESFLAALTTTFGDRPRRNEPMLNHTTLRLGGPAEVWLPVENIAELVTAVNLARQHQVPLLVLGGGANLLIGDAGIGGVVIQNRSSRVEFPPQPKSESEQVAKVVADSGVLLPNFARRCARRGLSGLEWAVGVPGTIGGAVVNNAGAYGSDMAHSLVRAELLSPDGEQVWQPVGWFDYDYRTSKLKGREKGWIVLRAELEMAFAPVAEVKARVDIFNAQRRASQPPGATSGSMFKNPPGDYAGRLIEAAGLKGHRLGQAQISPIHANFFQNLGGASAAEILRLIEMAQETVRARFGVELELEIEVMGEF